MSKAPSKPRPEKASAFLDRAERAFERAAEAVLLESRRLGVKPLTWKDPKAAKAKK